MNELFERSDINYLKDKIDTVYSELIEVLDNEKKRTDGYLLADLVSLDKLAFSIKSSELITVLNELKKIKPFNPNKK